MKSWYMTREAGTLAHRGIRIPAGKKIYLSEDQAKLHGDKVEISTAPENLEAAGVEAEYKTWANQKPKQTAPTTPATKTEEEEKDLNGLD